MKTISVTSEIKRIRKGYRPASNAWYYHVLYDVRTLISIIKMCISNMLNMRSGYKCPRCGKESNDANVIFDCIHNHEYVEGKKMKLTQKKCKNCNDSVISQDGGVTWIHGIIANGRPWLTPINSLCINPEGQIDG